MKNSVAVTLIICGTLLVALPYIHNAFVTSIVAQTMSTLDKTVNLTAHLPRYADVGCMLGGLFAILAGTGIGFANSKRV